MMEENEKVVDYTPDFSWWSDSHNRSYQSPWLQATLSDLDKKTKVIVDLIQNNGDTFAKRAEMFYERRPLLIKMLRDLYESYVSLAETYDRLISKSSHLAHRRSASSSSLSRRFHFLHDYDIGNAEITKVEPPATRLITDPAAEENSSLEIHSFSFHLDPLSTLTNEPIPGNKGTNKLKAKTDVDGERTNDDALQMDSLEGERLRTDPKLKMSKLVEDNLLQQSELVKRNEEKREVIRNLRAQVNKLMDENRALKNCLMKNKFEVKRNLSNMSKLKAAGLDCIGNFRTS